MDATTVLDSVCTAYQNGRLVVLWGHRPFALLDRAPANRFLQLTTMQQEVAALGSPPNTGLSLLPDLPPLLILSIDPTNQVERAFQTANIPLSVVLSTRDVPRRGRHNLLKLAGDLRTRCNVALSRSEVRAIQNDPDLRYILEEAYRVARTGAVLLFSCAPADQDWAVWWDVLAMFRMSNIPFYTLANDPLPDVPHLNLTAAQLVEVLQT